MMKIYKSFIAYVYYFSLNFIYFYANCFHIYFLITNKIIIKRISIINTKYIDKNHYIK